MLDLRSSTYLISIGQQILICIQRGFLRLRNNYVPAVSTVIANAILAIVVGSHTQPIVWTGGLFAYSSGIPAMPSDKPLAELGRSEYAAPFIQQLIIVTRRIFQEYWRDPTYLYSKLALCAGVCFFNSISFYNTPIDVQGFINFLFSIFLISQLFSTLDQQIIPRLANSRRLFETVASIVIFVTWYYPTGLWRNGDPSFDMAERGGLVFVSTGSRGCRKAAAEESEPNTRGQGSSYQDSKGFVVYSLPLYFVNRVPPCGK
ncbi:hypothetical protein GGR54DRAFT_294268 [Hypoxylon sp. NC1633]|nr:hypothetical protein GGR54DRAFT_294268 [Hypoxylon sp. NC1633]